MAQKPPPSNPTTLFVRNLPPQTTKADLSAHFSGVGPLRRTVLVTSPDTGLCTGIAFIHYALPQNATTALQTLHGSMLRNRRIFLDVAKPRLRSNTDADGGLLPKHKPVREDVKKKGALKGSVAMRTVVVKKEAITEEHAKNMFDGMNVENIVKLGGGEVRVRFASWAEAGKAAAKVHGQGCQAWIEALAGGKGTRVIVRNLPFKVCKAELTRVFGAVKPVRDVWLAPSMKKPKEKEQKEGRLADIRDNEEKETDEKASEHVKKGEEEGQQLVDCGGFAFVEYFLVADAKYVVQKLNGVKVGGRVVAVDMAMGKSKYMKTMEAEEDKDEDEEVEEGGAENDAKEEKVEEENDSVETDGNAVHEDVSSDSGDEESEQEDEDEPEVTLQNEDVKKEGKSTPEELERTVFVRNLLYETSAAELRKAMKDEFGRVEQAVLVMHPVTKRPRGTAFVRFANKKDAEKALARGAGDTSRTRSAMTSANETSFSLQGRPLMISKAVDRSKAKHFSEKNDKEKGDPRNIRLAGFGQVLPGSPEAKVLSEEDLQRYIRWAKEKKNKLERNPNAFVSDVRLCVRNLPREVDEKILKQLFLLAGQNAGGGKKELVRITHCTVVRDGERNGRSKGYGFVQFERHEQAMTALKRLSNNDKVGEILIKAKPKALKLDQHRERALKKMWGGRRLHVEFSVEDKRKVLMIERIKEKGRKLAEEHRLKKEQGEDGAVGEKSEKRGRKRKRGEGKENEMENGQKRNRAEKKSALKRKRAEAGAETGMGGKSQQRDGRDGNKTQRKKDVSKEKEYGMDKDKQRAKREEDGDMQGVGRVKKTRRRGNKGEHKEEKLDSLIAAYKRKLNNGVKKATQTDGGSSSELQASTLRRWFE